MAAVKIDSGGLPSAVGVEGNALMRVIARWASIADGRFPDDCEALLQMVDETDRLRLWEKNIGGHTYRDRNEFLQRCVLIDFDMTEEALDDIVTRLRRGETPTMRAMRIAQKAKKLAGHGGDHKSEAVKDQDDNVILKEQGNSAAYLAARLKRDHREIADQLARGKFKSVRAAAIAAGIVKPPPSAQEHVEKLLPKLSIDGLRAIVKQAERILKNRSANNRQRRLL